jgi:hypothetical protein
MHSMLVFVFPAVVAPYLFAIVTLGWRTVWTEWPIAAVTLDATIITCTDIIVVIMIACAQHHTIIATEHVVAEITLDSVLLTLWLSTLGTTPLCLLGASKLAALLPCCHS